MANIQKADGDKQRSDDQGRDSHLRLSDTIVFCSIVGIDLVRKPYSNHRSDDEPKAETEIGKTRGSDTEPISLTEEV